MNTYHVSINNYESGTIIRTNNYYPITQERGHAWVEDLLEKYRPEDAPSRLTCVFTFPDLAQAMAYGGRLPGDVNYYRVEIDDHPTSCPMVLCKFITDNKIKGEEYLSKICQHYWTPGSQWQFYELLSSHFVVLEKINITDFSERKLGTIRYQGDIFRSTEMFRQV